QRLMYERIGQLRSVRKLYTEDLVNRGDLTVEEAERSLEEFSERLRQAFEETRQVEPPPSSRVDRERPEPIPASPMPTGVPRETLQGIADRLATVPDGFHVHPKLERWLGERGGALD